MIWYDTTWCKDMGVSKNRGKTPQMDGENFNGKPYESMDDLGKTHYFPKHLGATLHPPAGSPWLPVLTCFLHRVRAMHIWLLKKRMCYIFTVYVLYNCMYRIFYCLNIHLHDYIRIRVLHVPCLVDGIAPHHYGVVVVLVLLVAPETRAHN